MPTPDPATDRSARERTIVRIVFLMKTLPQDGRRRVLRLFRPDGKPRLKAWRQ